ncbi:hypothetical protein CALVIDRAFT_595040 [Calocera viscosa TUFC12733]|uniref:Uncharacterized protein n=1 Tax=Calocera viscosa (strain TUFC12733) TaxID=1330018 RepID=A0A167RG93_CALVF|nr:hypothetical protein CALVIDRAFT_595040 [Calocera viscosa TUFC12733]
MFPTGLRRFTDSGATPTPGSSSGPTPTPSKRPRPYMDALRRLSQRTGTPLPSLIVSFGIVHEVTALAPLFGFFFASRWLGIGQTTVDWAARNEGWEGEMVRGWMREGGEMAERVGGRYGWFGYEKMDKAGRDRLKEDQKKRRETGQEAEQLGAWIAGDVANFVVAYGLNKASLFSLVTHVRPVLIFMAM